MDAFSDRRVDRAAAWRAVGDLCGEVHQPAVEPAGLTPNVSASSAVGDDPHAVLRQRAAAAHQSLQEYLRTKLIQEASAPTVEEVLDRAGGRAGGRVPIKTATQILREDRDRR